MTSLVAHNCRENVAGSVLDDVMRTRCARFAIAAARGTELQAQRVTSQEGKSSATKSYLIRRDVYRSLLRVTHREVL